MTDGLASFRAVAVVERADHLASGEVRNSSRNRHARSVPTLQVGVGQPRELHDRPARRVKDESLDILGFAFHATALAGQEGDLGYRGHDVEIQGGAGGVIVAGYGRYGLMAALRMSIVSVGFRDSARCA
jgi:hypothetical protein